MLGEAYAFASASCFAAANVTIARGAVRGAEDNGAFLSLLITIAISGACWAFAGTVRGFPALTGAALLWFVTAGVLTAFIGRVFLYASVQDLGAVRASALKRLNPFFAALLGIAVLGEAVSPGMAVGMLLILASFGILVQGEFRARVLSSGPNAAGGALANLGYVYGLASALGYAAGNLVRKLGLNETPDAFLGTMLGTLTGAFLFVAAGAFRPSYRKAVRATLRRPSPWLVLAGVLSSAGQILYLAALNASDMSRVAMVASMEVFVTLFLTAVFLRAREHITRGVIVAAALGVAGTGCLVGF